MKDVNNYIFDLYGTLLDVVTDESSPTFWKRMAALFSVYGADYTGPQLQKAYLDCVTWEEAALKKHTGYQYPEIRLEKVFGRLLLEAPSCHACEGSAGGTEIEALRAMARSGDEGKKQALEKLYYSEWVHVIANTFRLMSRKKLKPYKNTIKVLTKLKQTGHRVYLLSNAQHIFTVPEMEAFGLTEYFDRIAISSDAGMKKPQPEFMVNLLRREGIDRDDCVMVGNDYDSDIRIAASLGMASVYLNTFGYSEQECEKRLAKVRSIASKTNPKAKDYKPSLSVMDGDIGALLDIIS
ncbi:MAG: HAD family hydrolase [Lachnospiraceae bacterium]|nr:HAD family hydrolase [Lachnospiraceae bacterium]